MAEQHLLAVDLGAESGRTVLARFDGRRLQLEETHRFPNQPVVMLGTLYWDLPRLWHEVQAGISLTCRQAAPGSIGVDTWGVDFAFLDEHGDVLANPVHYRDGRTTDIFTHAFRILPKEEIYRRTGLQFLSFNTLFQLLAIQREGKSYANAARLLFMPDVFHYLLSGVATTEWTIASTSQMADPRTRDWSSEILTAFGIPRTLLPTIEPTGTLIGPVLAEVAGGSARGMQAVRTAGHDTGSAIVAVPGAGNDWCYISSGTWSLMGAEIPEPRITDTSLADNFTNEGGLSGTSRFLKNIMGLWLVQECRRSFERAGRGRDYAEMVQMAASAPAFVAVLNPDDSRFLRPDDMPNAIGQFCAATGQTTPADDASMVRTCLESLALCYRRTLAMLEQNLGRRMERIHIVGGGSRNELLCQWTADACGRQVIAGPVEATAAGNALVQLLATGELHSAAEMREVIRASFPLVTYEPRGGADWDAAADQFERLIAR